MKTFSSASLWLLLTGLMMLAASSCGTMKKANEVSTYSVGGGCGYIDKMGQIAIEPQYDFAYFFYDGLAKVEVDGKYGFIDKTGKMVVEPQFDYVYPFHEGLAPVEVDEKWGFVDKTGKMVVDLQFDIVHDFDEGLAPVEVDEKWGFIDKTGKMVVEPQYVAPGISFHDGLAEVRKGDPEETNYFRLKSGFIDKKGQVVIDFQYDETSNFSEGLSYVEKNGQSAFIDKTGKVIIEGYDWDDDWFYQIESSPEFHEGLCPVCIPEKYGLRNGLGKIITEPLYDELEKMENGLFIARTNDKYGIIDKKGKVLVDFEFDYDDVFLSLEILEKLSR